MRFFLFVLVSGVVGCAAGGPVVQEQAPRGPESAKTSPELTLVQLQGQLGLNRDLQDLGFAEKSFDSCRSGMKDKDGKCGIRHLSVIQFRLLCRDTEETVSEVAHVSPLVSNAVVWKLGDLSGETKTDSGGYGQVRFVTNGPIHGQRLVLVVGRQFLGLEVSQMRQIVVPVYWCFPR